jgi:SAM-dependent methyltransferase
MLRVANRWLMALGFNPFQFANALRELPGVVKEYRTFKRQCEMAGLGTSVRFSQPSMGDKKADCGTARGHYFYQDLFVAQQVFRRSPDKHVDIGSRVDGFVAHVAAFREIEVFDIRPMNTQADNIIFRQCDIKDLPPGMSDYCDSLSCLHVLEHFGLGRYGDEIDVAGHIRGFAHLHKILKKDGILYLSVPIGEERVDFNGHRVFNIATILDLAASNYVLERFSYVDDAGDFHGHVALDGASVQNNFNCDYGCGIFELRKIK